MSFYLSLSPTQNDLPILQVSQQPYLSSSQSLIFLTSQNKILYHGYKNKDKQQPKTQSNTQKPLEDTKPKKKFNFKVTKNTQSKTLIEISEKVSTYSISQNTWHTLQLKGKPPIPRENHCLISMNSKNLIMYGGKSLQNQKLLNDLHVLNLQTFLWKKLFSIECPSLSQSNIIIKLTETKIIMINFKQVWTFQSKDVNWDLNTNQLPGGLWQNLQIKVDSLLDQQRQVLLTGVSTINEESSQHSVVFFTVDKNSQQINSYTINLSQKEINKVKFQKDIFLDDLSNRRNLMSVDVFEVQNNYHKRQNLILITTKRKDSVEITLLQIDFQSLSIKIVDSKVNSTQQEKQINFIGQCMDSKNKNLYILSSADKNPKEKHLKTLTFDIKKIDSKSPKNNQKKNTQKLSSGYLTNSQIHSIPEESNQSSFIGVKNHQNQRYQQFQDQSQHSKPYESQFLMVNSQRRKQNSSRVASQIDRSPSSVVSKEEESFISNDNDNMKNQIPAKKNQKPNKSRMQNNSNIYSSPCQQLLKPNNDIENNSSSFPQEQYLQSTLQKILVYEHLKRQKLEQKSKFLQRSIKSSQNLAKLLTKFATPNQKNNHIEQVKYLKQELENIWNKEIFFRRQIQHHFVNSKTQNNIRSSFQRQRHSRDSYKQKSRGKIDMRKLLQKHNLLQEQ